jgi:NADPH:quinone reductase-like Zn-dependent oxidoreductase
VAGWSRSRIERVRQLAPEGVDAALDCHGGDAVVVSQQVLKDPARVVSVADLTVTDQGGHLVWA